MQFMKYGLVLLGIGLSIILGISSESAQAKDGDLDKLIAHVSPPPPPQKKLYTAYNMRHKRGVVSTVNYQVNNLISAGTEVIKVVLADNSGNRWTADLEKQKVSKGFGGSNDLDAKSVKFTIADGNEYRIDFKKRHHPESSIWSIAKQMFTEKTPSEMFDGMNDQDISAIKSGQVLEGMTMDQVILSMGIPPEHKTPDAMNNLKWQYWITRTMTKDICFDSDKLTIRCNVIPEGQRTPL